MCLNFFFLRNKLFYIVATSDLPIKRKIKLVVDEININLRAELILFCSECNTTSFLSFFETVASILDVLLAIQINIEI